MKEPELDQTRVAMSALFACLVQAIDDVNPGVKERFQEHLRRTHSEMKDYKVMHTGALETLMWTAEHLRRQ